MRDLLKAKVDLKLLKYNLSNYKAYIIIYAILLFSVGGLPLIITYIGTSGGIIHGGDPQLPVSLVLVTMLLMLVTPFIVYGYLTSKKSVDVFHALPITRNDLFATQVLTSFVMVYLPFILNFFVYYGLQKGLGFDFDAQYMLHIIIYTILFFSIQIIPSFVIQNTGTTSDALIHTGILIALPYLVVGAYHLFISTYVFGIHGVDVRIYNYISPFYPLFKVIFNEYGWDFKLLAYWLVLNAIAFHVTMRLYRFRKSEKSEEPFVNTKYFPIIINTFIPLSFIIMNVSTLQFQVSVGLSEFFSVEAFVLPLLLTFVGHILLNIFRYRSTKYFLKSTLDFLKVMLVTIMVSTLLITTHGFGIAWKLPNASSVESISFKPYELNDINPILTSGNRVYLNYETTVELRDPQAIEKFIEIHKEINSIFKETKGDRIQLVEKSIVGFPLECGLGKIREFSFTYNLKNGNKKEKTITLPVELLLNFGKLLEYENYQVLMKPLLNTDIESQNIRIFNNIKSEVVTPKEKDFAQKLREAYLKDINMLSYQNLMFEQAKLKYIVQYDLDANSYKQNTNGVNFNIANKLEYYKNLDNYLFIDERFSSTLALLNQYELEAYETDFDYFLNETGAIEYSENYGGCGTITYNAYSMDQYHSVNLENIGDYQDKLLGSYISKDIHSVLQIQDNIQIPLLP